jgi:hypothetical protein
VHPPHLTTVFITRSFHEVNYCSSCCPDQCRGGAKEANPDERIVVGHDLMAAPVDMTLRAAYPDLYPLHETGE